MSCEQDFENASSAEGKRKGFEIDEMSEGYEWTMGKLIFEPLLFKPQFPQFIFPDEVSIEPEIGPVSNAEV